MQACSCLSGLQTQHTPAATHKMGGCEGFRASPRKSKLWLVAQAFCLLASLHSAACIDGPKDYRQKFKVGREDFVISMPVDQKHLTVAKGSRAWRQVNPQALQDILSMLTMSSATLRISLK